MSNKRTITLVAAALLAAGQPAAAWDDDDGWGEDAWDDAAPSPWQWHGFSEAAGGLRTQNNPLFAKDAPLGELRLQQELQYLGERMTWRFKGDLVADAVRESVYGDLREANVSLPLGQRTDVRVGRQVLTWGTGDMLFLNDLFPKDWQSFLIGRDDDYLKAPSDALRLSWFGRGAGLDVVWTPVFAPDRFVDGRRLSYFSPMAGERVADRVRDEAPDRELENGELAVRWHGMLGSTEWALYGYRGFFGQPTAFNPQPTDLDPMAGELTYARLNAYGASLRAPLAGGLYNLEAAWYDSVDDRRGDDPLRPNSELRFLAGYDRELFANFNLGAQYYLEWLQDYDRFEDAWQGDPAYRPDEYRHLLTARLSYRMLRDNLTLSLMSFYSPSAEDYLLRPSVDYRYTDRLRLTAGANLFGGDAHSFFGQFERDSSVYARVRYSY